MPKLRRYLFYAIGEIILVVIGILIAVSINNWNEDKKEEAKLTTYLQDYRKDLMIDSAVVRKNIELLKLKKPAFDLVLSDTLTKGDLINNLMTLNLTLTYNPVKLQSKGYNELTNYITSTNTETDTLVQRIVAEHATYQNFLDTTIENIANDIADNMQYLKNNKLWLNQLFKQQLTDEVLDYFISEDYKNRVAVHQVLVYGNLNSFFLKYQQYIEITLKSLDQRLAKI